MRQFKVSKQITERDSYAMERYLMEISKISALRPDEEAALAIAIRNGDKRAEERLVVANLRFVVSVAKQYQHYGLRLEDLINEGNMGLLKAARIFDETKGFKFISYAVWWIRQSILQAIADNSRMIRLPLNKITALNKMVQSNQRLEQKLGREPSPEEIAEDLNLNRGDVMENISISGTPFSIEMPVNEAESALFREVYAATDNLARQTEKMILHDSFKIEMERFFAGLSDREVLILKMHYGLDGETERSLEEIAYLMKVSAERIRQIKNRALKKLKQMRNNGRLESYMFELAAS
ncbi:MAG: RNA polymerase sigma factor RpoD/SigA [Marinifilaceae bacterium]|nr:RNA polymerase sigma factor RpoD/SigA [Marinifilaceae bacterium]